MRGVIFASLVATGLTTEQVSQDAAVPCKEDPLIEEGVKSAQEKKEMHVKKVKELKARGQALQDALKQAQDNVQADKDEAEGHFRQAKKIDAEAKALGDARKIAAKRAKDDTAKLHAEKEKQAGDAAKSSAKDGAAKMHGKIFEELKARVQVVAKTEVHKAADAAVKKEVAAAGQHFMAALRGQMILAARKDGKSAALAAAKVAIAAHHDKFGRVTKAVADQAKIDVKKMAEKKAEKEVKKSAKKHVGKHVSKKAELAAHAAVLKATASYKKDMGNLGDQMSKKQLDSYKSEEAGAKKHGVNLIPPESKKFEEEKLLYILHKYGPKKALDDARLDVVDATDEHEKAVHMLGEAEEQARDAQSDLTDMKTPEERKLAEKVVFDTKREVDNAKDLVTMTAANLRKQDEVKEHTDKMVRDYEAGKNAQIAKGAKEASDNKKNVAAAKLAAKKAAATAKCPKDKADAEKALGKAKETEAEGTKHEAKTDEAVKASKHASDLNPSEKATAVAIDSAKKAHAKLAKAVVLHKKAQEVVASTADPAQRAMATSIEAQARAAKEKAKSEADDALSTAKSAADKEKTDVKKTGAGPKADADAAETALAKSHRDKKKLKRETEIQYQLSKLEADISAVDKDLAVLTRLKTATGAQVAYDIGKLKQDIKNTPKIKSIQQHRAESLLKKAASDQKKAAKKARQAKKVLEKAIKFAHSPDEKKTAMKLLKKSKDANEDDEKVLRQTSKSASKDLKKAVLKKATADATKAAAPAQISQTADPVQAARLQALSSAVPK